MAPSLDPEFAQVPSKAALPEAQKGEAVYLLRVPADFDFSTLEGAQLDLNSSMISSSVYYCFL